MVKIDEITIYMLLKMPNFDFCILKYAFCIDNLYSKVYNLSFKKLHRINHSVQFSYYTTKIDTRKHFRCQFYFKNQFFKLCIGAGILPPRPINLAGE